MATATAEVGLTAYEITSLDGVLTPALVIYPEIVRSNISETLRVLGGDGDRWRPHVKTAKLESVMHMLVEAGVPNFKCATTLELLVACRAGARDVLVAYAHTGANARRVVDIAKAHPEVRVSALVDTAEQIGAWEDTPVSLFLDINPGMDRTGLDENNHDAILTSVKSIQAAGIEFRGLHYYDGHQNDADLERRIQAAHRGYDRLCAVVQFLEGQGVRVPEVITAGTPAFPAAVSYAGFQNASFKHRVSPGTVVYNDLSSTKLLPQCHYLPAVFVISRVISHPRPGIVTCDAGHKSLSVDAGVPHGAVLGHETLTLSKPSEEHLPIEVPVGTPVPAVGSLLYLIPKHVCPTVNNFDFALIVEDHKIARVEPVGARGREYPLAAGLA